MTFEQAEYYCTLPIDIAIVSLLQLKAIVSIEDETIIYTIGPYSFFKCYDDSKTLYFES